MVDTEILLSDMKSPSHYCLLTFWTVTSYNNLPTRLSTNFMTLIPRLTFTYLWVVSMEHLQRVWHVSRERLSFNPPFWTCLCSNCSDQISRTCLIFTRPFTLYTPRYTLGFASNKRFLVSDICADECSLTTQINLPSDSYVIDIKADMKSYIPLETAAIFF